MIYHTERLRNRFILQSRPARQALRPLRHPGACRIAFASAYAQNRLMGQLEQVLVSLAALLINTEAAPLAVNEHIERALETLRVIGLAMQAGLDAQENGARLAARQKPRHAHLRPAKSRSKFAGWREETVALPAHILHPGLPENPCAA